MTVSGVSTAFGINDLSAAQDLLRCFCKFLSKKHRRMSGFSIGFIDNILYEPPIVIRKSQFFIVSARGFTISIQKPLYSQGSYFHYLESVIKAVAAPKSNHQIWIYLCGGAPNPKQGEHAARQFNLSPYIVKLFLDFLFVDDLRPSNIYFNVYKIRLRFTEDRIDPSRNMEEFVRKICDRRCKFFGHTEYFRYLIGSNGNNLLVQKGQLLACDSDLTSCANQSKPASEECDASTKQRLIPIEPKVKTIQCAIFSVIAQNAMNVLRTAQRFVDRGDGKPDQQRKQNEQEGGETPIHAALFGLKPDRYASRIAFRSEVPA